MLPFLGSRALAAPNSNFFTIAVIPDTQNYSDGTYPQPLNKTFFKEQTSYLAQNVLNLKLRFVTHVGDVVQHGDGRDLNFPARFGTPQNIEWLNAIEAFDILDASGVPWGAAPGNHDFDNYAWNTLSRPLVMTSANWNTILGSNSKYFKGKSWYGGASDNVGYISTGSNAANSGEYFTAGTPLNYGLSSFQIFSAGGRKFLHISLEFEPGDAAIAWAQSVINNHLGYATIVTTHSFLSPPAWGDNNPPLTATDVAVRNGVNYLNGSPAGANTGQQIWDKFLSINPQIFLTLHGHSWDATQSVQAPTGLIPGVSKGQNIRIDLNNAGYPVYQILTDYQGNTTFGSAGGDGWLRLMQFDLDANSIHFYTPNIHQTLATGSLVLAGQNTIFSDGQSDFDQPKGFSDFTLAIPPQVLSAPKGAH